MTHSKMVQTRRRREAAKKREARAEKLAKKLEKHGARPESRSPEASPTAP